MLQHTRVLLYLATLLRFKNTVKEEQIYHNEDVSKFYFRITPCTVTKLRFKISKCS